MNTIRTRRRARTMHGSVGMGTHRGGCRVPSLAATGAEIILQRVNAGEPMTLAELLHAAAVLDRFVLSGRLDVLAARVRIAVRLEQLGA